MYEHVTGIVYLSYPALWLCYTPTFPRSVILLRFDLPPSPFSCGCGLTAMPAVGLQGGSRGNGKLQGAWGLYLDALERRPIRTKSLSSGVISGTANFLEQTLGAAPFVSVGVIRLLLEAVPRR